MNTSPRKVNVCALFCLLVSMLLLTLMSGCSDDDCETCPTCPEVKTHNDIYDGLLYVGMSGVPKTGDIDIYVFDTRTESLVDSIDIGSNDVGHLDITANGRYLAVGDEQATTRIFDAKSLELIKSIGMQASPTFMSGDHYLLTHRLKTWVYSVENFHLVHEDTVDILSDIRRSTAGNSFFAVRHHDALYEYSLDSFQVARSWQPCNQDGMPYALWNFDLSNQDRVAHMIVQGVDGSAVVTWDLIADTLINEHPITVWTGEVCANRFGDEVYVTEPGAPYFYGVGTIYIFDQKTGKYLDGISLFGYRDDPMKPLTARNMSLAPDGSQLYVVSDASHWEPGTVLRIDTKTRQVESLLFPLGDFYPYSVAIGPKP